MDPTPELPAYGEVRDALARFTSGVDPAAVHGAMCAVLSVGREPGRVREWLALVLPDGAFDEHLDADTEALLRALSSATATALDDPQMRFRPLLPLEGRSLGERTEALSAWCNGFLYGLRAAGVEDEALPEEAREVAHDLAHIANVDFELEDADEHEEEAFAEVVEYVRMGALLVHEELRGPRENESVH